MSPPDAARPAPPPHAQRLDARRTLLVILFGAALWFVGIFQIRWAGASGVLSDGRTPVVYGLIVLATVPFVWLAPRLVGLPRAYRLHCAALMGAVAALLDGLAVRWTRWYTTDPQLLANSAGALLWAIGAAVALGFVMSAPRPGKG